MKILFVITSLVFGLACHAAEQASSKTKFYIQIVRGSDEATPPEAGAKLVGARIQKQLQPVFRWKNYWEVQRSTLVVEEGRTSKIELKSGHALEIDLRQKGKRTVHLYRDKKLVRTFVCSRAHEFTIQGTEPGDGKIWFVVVRTDSPAT